MNKLMFTGRATNTPELQQRGDKTYARVRLIRNEYIGTDDAGHRMEREVSIQFTAFGRTAEAMAKNVMKGDQLIIFASISNNNYEKDGAMHYSFNFDIHEFEFGAPGAEKRKFLADRQQN